MPSTEYGHWGHISLQQTPRGEQSDSWVESSTNELGDEITLGISDSARYLCELS